MAYQLDLPDIGEGLTEAEIVRWHVAVGETVGVNEPLVEVETDKAVVEIPSPHGGVLLHQGGAEGTTIKVGSLLASIGAAGEVWAEKTTAVPAHVVVPAPARPTNSGRVLAMPLVRRLAKDLGVNLESVVGSGPGGKVTRADVQAAGESVADETPAASPLAPASAAVPAAVSGFEGETLSAMRRTIARNLTQSWTEIPHVTVWRPADATRILEAKKETGAPLEALLIKAVLPVLAEFPTFNALFDGKTLSQSEGAQIGIAMNTDAGLMVPVIRDAETLNLRQLGDEVLRLSKGAAERSLGLGELTGGTFTVSNVGAVGGGFGTPIIPYGTTSIVSVGRAEDDVVVRNKAIAIAPVFPVSLSFDHRVIDGAIASQFLRMFVDQLESYGLAR